MRKFPFIAKYKDATEIGHERNKRVFVCSETTTAGEKVVSVGLKIFDKLYKTKGPQIVREGIRSGAWSWQFYLTRKTAIALYNALGDYLQRTHDEK